MDLRDRVFLLVDTVLDALGLVVVVAAVDGARMPDLRRLEGCRWVVLMGPSVVRRRRDDAAVAPVTGMMVVF